MIKRVAWVTGESSNNVLTPNKAYSVFNEDGDSFNITDDKGGTRFCLKKGCAHICNGDWMFADVVEEENVVEAVEDAAQPITTKQPKWSKWIKNTTGKCPEGLKRKQKVKLKWSDGDKFVIDNPRVNAWYFSEGDNPVDITHYKVKLKDLEKSKSKWTKNKGVRPVDGDIEVEFKRRDGDKYKDEAGECDWRLQGQDYDIIKWRLAD